MVVKMSYLLIFSVFFPMAGAVISYLLGRKNKNIRDYFADSVVIAEFGLFLFFTAGMLAGKSVGEEGRVFAVIPQVCGMGLHFTLDGFRALYGTIAAFMWMMTTLFSKEYFVHYRNRNRYYLFMLITLGATIGVFLSADFYTTFLFFEIMSLTSYVWVAHDEKKESLRAAATYLAVAIIGGLVMLMGIFLLYSQTGTLMFHELTGIYQEMVMKSNSGLPEKKIMAAGLCMLFGFGAKAGAFPLHIWLPKAHPVAPAPASALLSGILTKAGMFGILILSCYLFLGNTTWGSLILGIGVITMALGAVLALFSVDLKRTLACSSVSQIGFILVGVGMAGLLGEENALAARGSLLHMVNHSLIKLVLFMAAGVVFMNAHKLNLNDIRGFGRKKPLLQFIFLMGALGIGGIPLWNGYISKTLIHESIVEYMMLLEEGMVKQSIFSAGMMKGVEWIFLISGGLTVAYMTKLYVALFIEKNSDSVLQEKYDSLKGKYMNKTSAFALTGAAVILPVMGCLPNRTMDEAANLGQGFLQVTGEVHPVAYFFLVNLKGALISIVIGAAVYAAVVRLWMMKKENGVRIYVNRWYRYLDLEDYIYRPVLLKVLPFAFGVLCRIFDSLLDGIIVLLRKTLYKDSKLPHELEEGTRLTHLAGMAANRVVRIGNATVWHKNPKTVDYEHKYAMIQEEWREDTTMIGRSLSFGLILFCIGLIITVIYILI